MEFTDIFPVDKLYIYLIILLISALIYWKVPKDIALPVVLICLFSFASIYFFFGRVVNQNIRALGFDHRDSKGRSAGFVSALMMLGLLLS